MNASEAAALLAIAAAFDNRKPDADAASAWAVALDELPAADCRDAIVQHYRESRDWLMPSDVIRRVKKMRTERLQLVRDVQPPPELTDLEDDDEFNRAYLEWRRELDQRAIHGELDERDTRHAMQSVTRIDKRTRAAIEATRKKLT